MYNQPFRGNTPTSQPQHMHGMHQQQQIQPPNVSAASSMAQHQMMMASQGMRQQFPGMHFHPQHSGQQHVMQMSPQLYPQNVQQQQQQQQMNQQQMNQHQIQQQMNMQHQGLLPGQIGPLRPPHPMFSPMGPQHQGPPCPPGFPPQQRFPQHPHQFPPMRYTNLDPQLVAQQPHQPSLQQTSVMNPNIFAPPMLLQHSSAIQRPPPVRSPQQMNVQVPPLSQSLQPLPRLPPPVPAPPQQIMPIDVPYYDLPAGLMVPLVKPEDHEYKPLNPKLVKIPPPQAPSEKLLKAVEDFYSAPSLEKRRDADGWEEGALEQFFKMKQETIAKVNKEKVFTETPKCEEKKENVQSQDPTPKRRYKEEKSPDRKRSSRRSKSRSPKERSRSRRRRRSPSSSSSGSESDRSSRSKSRSPRRHSRSDRQPSNRYDNKKGGNSSRHAKRRSRSHSPVEFKPSFSIAFEMKDKHTKLEDTNKGAQLLLKMGWSGTGGLGSSQQGISEPVAETGTVRDSGNMYHGIGVEERSDAYESYRKSRGQAFLDRIQRTRDDK